MWEARHDCALSSSLFKNIASIGSMCGALTEKNEATPPEAAVIWDEWGVIQRQSRVEGVECGTRCCGCR